ncbi:hypothetical protein C8E17_3193 [Serratia plymuthica]|nr:hypothetical protein C8E17_3193 [Serratia plymuthica]CAI2485536.1 Uncharacterised protein [Serratia plymuthica]
MGHIRVSHPAGRHEVVPICSRQIGRRVSRYDPFGTLSLIIGFVSSLRSGKPDLFDHRFSRQIGQAPIFSSSLSVSSLRIFNMLLAISRSPITT